LLMNQVIEHRRHAETTFRIDIRSAVLEDHHASRLLGIVLSRHINPVIAGRSWIDGAGPGMLGDFPLGNVSVLLGVRPKLVIVGSVGRDTTDQGYEGDTEETQ